MNKTLNFFFVLTVLPLVLASCKSDYEVPAPDKVNLEYISEEKDLSSLQNELQNFVGSYMRASNLGLDSSFDVLEYELSRSDIAMRLNNDNYYVATAKNRNSINEYITFVSDNGVITSASKIVMGKTLEGRMPFSYKSILDDTILFSGFVDVSKNTVTIDYIDGDVRLNSGLRASAAGLLCNVAVWGAGASWCYALSLISGGASVALSLAVTVAGYYICDNVE